MFFIPTAISLSHTALCIKGYYFYLRSGITNHNSKNVVLRYANVIEKSKDQRKKCYKRYLKIGFLKESEEYVKF